MVGYKGEADEDLVPRLVSYVLDFGNSICPLLRQEDEGENPNIEIRNNIKIDTSVKSPPPSLRGAKRRGNLVNITRVMRLPRFARNDKSAFFGLFTRPSMFKTETQHLTVLVI